MSRKMMVEELSGAALAVAAHPPSVDARPKFILFVLRPPVCVSFLELLMHTNLVWPAVNYHSWRLAEALTVLSDVLDIMWS